MFGALARIEAKGGDSWRKPSRRTAFESKSVALRAMFFATLREQDMVALISAKGAEIRQIEPFAVRLESVRL